ncbi:MAG: hypothetical protein ABR506_05610 [Candidatus Krumholzibacteriia bacterium]|nr:hypothetical protein [Thioalkalivibrio sp.]
MVAAVVVAALCGFVGNAAGADPAVAPPQHVVGETGIQAAIDQSLVQADADREAILAMLQREDVRRIAGAAGLDLERASAAAATMSGPALERMADQARALDNDLVGGEGRVVMTTTAIIIILLILILLL